VDVNGNKVIRKCIILLTPPGYEVSKYSLFNPDLQILSPINFHIDMFLLASLLGIKLIRKRGILK
jgi:hypothetical protein